MRLFTLLSTVGVLALAACDTPAPAAPDLSVRLSVQGSCPADFYFIGLIDSTDRNGDGWACERRLTTCPATGLVCHIHIVRVDNSVPVDGQCPAEYESIPAREAPAADANDDGIICRLATSEGILYTDNDQ